jgi:hypothetical protein
MPSTVELINIQAVDERISESSITSYLVIKLCKVNVRPRLEYAVVRWSPWTVGDKEVLERVQRSGGGEHTRTG